MSKRNRHKGNGKDMTQVDILRAEVAGLRHQLQQGAQHAMRLAQQYQSATQAVCVLMHRVLNKAQVVVTEEDLDATAEHCGFRFSMNVDRDEDDKMRGTLALVPFSPEERVEFLEERDKARKAAEAKRKDEDEGGGFRPRIIRP